MNKKFIGPHVSIAGGLENAPLRAKELGASGFGMFTKNQRQWKAKDLTADDVAKFHKAMTDSGYTADMVLPHDSYLINLSHFDPEKYEKSLNAFIDELHRVEQLGLKYLNFHPGSHLKAMTNKESCDLIAQSLNRAMDETDSAVCVIENTAGQGSNMGSRFEEIARMIEGVKNRDRLGVCLDTCHTFAAGYDLVSQEAYEKTFEEFDRIIGFQFLKGMHLNDAKSTLNSHLDRHHSLGQGNIGWDLFERIMKDSRFDGIPLVLETIDDSLWASEVKQLRDWEDYV
jgi:deoxyribonuclease-4